MEKTCMNCGTEITKEYCEDFPQVCEHWTLKKPMTNADRIKAMSDEELANYMAKTLIANIAEALKIANIPWKPHADLQELTAKYCLEWLRQPAYPSKEE